MVPYTFAMNNIIPGIEMNLRNKPDPKKDGYLGIKPETDPNKLSVSSDFSSYYSNNFFVNKEAARNRLGDGSKNDLFRSPGNPGGNILTPRIGN